MSKLLKLAAMSVMSASLVLLGTGCDDEEFLLGRSGSGRPPTQPPVGTAGRGDEFGMYHWVYDGFTLEPRFVALWDCTYTSFATAEQPPEFHVLDAEQCLEYLGQPTAANTLGDGHARFLADRLYYAGY